jgi:ParB-like chromosome segregation protein Spo0J
MTIDIQYININDLKIPEWRANYTLRPDLMVISASLIDFGFIQPIHVRKETLEVIDGSERVLLARNIKQITKESNNKIPAIIHDVDSLEAMMLHLRLNRGRGSVVAKPMSRIIRKVIHSRKYSDQEIKRILSMKSNELNLMIDGSIFKTRNISDHKYSRAWVPIEAPPGTVDSGPTIERPPNLDR